MTTNGQEAGGSVSAAVRARLTGGVPLDRISAAVRRHPKSLVDELSGVPDLSSAVADVLDQTGRGSILPRSAVAPVGPNQRVIGPAVTLRYVALAGNPAVTRASGIRMIAGDRDLYGVAEPGDVAVMDCSCARGVAVMGGLSAAWAELAGVAGVVVDGAVRDSASILGTGLPVWCADRVPVAGRFRIEAAAINDLVMIGGAPVHPGDYLVGDDDGLCIVPHEDFPAVVEACIRAHAEEKGLLSLIAASRDVASLIEKLQADAPD